MSQPAPLVHKDRHSGVTKDAKKGGGGKGGWGKEGTIEEAYIPASDAFSDVDETEVKKSGSGDVVIVSKAIDNPNRDVIRIYLEEGDLQELEASIIEKKAYLQYEKLVFEAITLSIDFTGYERELVSRMLADLSWTIFNKGIVEVGFELVLAELKDIAIDAPHAPEMVGKFIARAVSDEVLAPSFFYAGKTPTLKAKEAVALARGLYNAPLASKRLAHVWGPMDKASRLLRATRTIAAEFFENEDISEAVEAVRSLKARAFHGHMVEELIKFGIERKGGSTLVVALLEGLVKSTLLSQESVSQGFALVERCLEDLQLDVPNALEVLGQFHSLAAEKNLIATE
mmetsp:Transcript_20178/g.77253  ORF Transcript_20178/g.77253 Transcript_20178/m.77253 type:complete len:342 (-) Transcript_20178:89-1114(-)|eukprot:CAMPEP_0114616870 /NCGR_PEP_ID=MMETSP0168-20121206/6908_1 /TAXON_ID=95228 ORGANISM="Vannella sp., Strain DIVA3 517/6/12" /NCGR_SAMPLE_ID=MMETSP0168 /ASSEMBLY_ACC=CAM_ASM_000044 /LENGTH=341 /DNA_ID=CAMNT_0001827995 /DNA_START=147 /DNA_END=1172 /DNA_ORIENTATION=-